MPKSQRLLSGLNESLSRQQRPQSNIGLCALNEALGQKVGSIGKTNAGAA